MADRSIFRRSAIFAFIVALAPVAIASPSSTPASPKARATTAHYVFMLSVGKSERLWSRAAARAKHPTVGEVVENGSTGGMTMSSGMAMAGPTRHLELRIRSRLSGKAVVGARPTLEVIDTSVRYAITIKVPLAELRGFTQGPADLHYGNNVELTGGHTYKATVKLNGESAILLVASPGK